MSKIENDRYWIVPRDKPGLLVAMMHALAGNTRISFEGDLSRCIFPTDLTLTHEDVSTTR